MGQSISERHFKIGVCNSRYGFSRPGLNYRVAVKSGVQHPEDGCTKSTALVPSNLRWISWSVDPSIIDWVSFSLC